MAVTFRNRTGSWKLVTDAIKARQSELPDLVEAKDELEALIVQADELHRMQQELHGDLKKTIRLRQEAEARGEELRQRLFGALHFRLGFKDEALHRFGMKPRRKRLRKTEEAPAPQPARPAPTSGDPAKQ
jgi:hypothetical protein